MSGCIATGEGGGARRKKGREAGRPNRQGVYLADRQALMVTLKITDQIPLFSLYMFSSYVQCI